METMEPPGLPTVIDGHEFELVQRAHPHRGWPQWRWVCSCGQGGIWRNKEARHIAYGRWVGHVERAR
jgi:hypothetical protein